MAAREHQVRILASLHAVALTRACRSSVQKCASPMWWRSQWLCAWTSSLQRCVVRRLQLAGCQCNQYSTTVCIVRNQWSASCRSCRQWQSNFSCSPKQPHQRPSLCRQCAGACAALCSPSGPSACRAALKASTRQALQGGTHKTVLDGNTRGPRHPFVASAGAAWCAPFLAVFLSCRPEHAPRLQFPLPILPC